MRHLYIGNLRCGLVSMIAVLIVLLTACGGSTSSTMDDTGQTPIPDINHTSLATLIGSPTAKVTQRKNFEVTGQVKNLDTKQHDIQLKATLINGSDQVVGTAIGVASNVLGGETDDYTLRGTLTQPTWASMSVAITQVTKNVSG